MTDGGWRVADGGWVTTAGALRVHCGCTAGTCIRDHPKEKEGGNIKHADAATQNTYLILRCLKSVVLTLINPNCNYAKAYKRGKCSNDMCHTPIYLYDCGLNNTSERVPPTVHIGILSV